MWQPVRPGRPSVLPTIRPDTRRWWRGRPHQPQLVVLEASGGYERAIVTALDGAGIAVSVRNPTQIRRFAQSLGKRAKTDRLDAQPLARYGEQLADSTPLPSEQLRTIVALLGRRRQLMKLRTQERNRAGQANDPYVASSIAAHLIFLEKQLKALTTQLTAAVRQVAALWERIAG